MSSMFTVIFEYSGGTYVSQFECADAAETLALWVKNPNSRMLDGVGFRGRKKIWSSLVSSSLASEKLVPLDGLKNVWCSFVDINRRSGLINIVKTRK